MRVVLLQNVEKLGEKFEIVDVKPGYARGFLLPRGLAEKVTDRTIALVKQKKEQLKQKAEKEFERISQLASKLEGREVVIEARVGEKGRLFGGVRPTSVAQELKSQGFDVKKSQIEIPEEIKELGEFPVKINLPHNLEAVINLIVKQEGDGP